MGKKVCIEIKDEHHMLPPGAVCKYAHETGSSEIAHDPGMYKIITEEEKVNGFMERFGHKEHVDAKVMPVSEHAKVDLRGVFGLHDMANVDDRM